MISEKIELIEDNISERVAETNMKKIKAHFRGLSNFDGTFSNIKMWKIKKQIMPRNYDPPMAKKDKDGNLVTSATKLKKLYQERQIDSK